MDKPAIPHPDDPRFRGNVKLLLETLTGRRTGSRIDPLDPDTATAADIARKVNEILDLLQG